MNGALFEALIGIVGEQALDHFETVMAALGGEQRDGALADGERLLRARETVEGLIGRCVRVHGDRAHRAGVARFALTHQGGEERHALRGLHVREPVKRDAAGIDFAIGRDVTHAADRALIHTDQDDRVVGRLQMHDALALNGLAVAEYIFATHVVGANGGDGPADPRRLRLRRELRFVRRFQAAAGWVRIEVCVHQEFGLRRQDASHGQETQRLFHLPKISM